MHQLSSLKAAAQEFMDQVLTQLRDKAAAGGGGSGPGELDTKQLRAKIEHAIEVCTRSFRPECSCWLARSLQAWLLTAAASYTHSRPHYTLTH